VDLASDAQTAVRDGDVLRVPPNLDQLESSVRLAGNVYQPGVFQWTRGMRLTDLLPFVKAEMRAAKLWRDEYESEPGAAATGSTSSEIGSSEWFEKTIDLIRQRFFTLKDFANQGRAYFSEDFDFDLAAVEKNLAKYPDLQKWLPELAERFEPMETFTEPEIEAVLNAFTEEKGTKLGVIMNGARTLLTGVAVGPSMLSVFETLGKDRSIMRLRSQIAWNVAHPPTA